MGAAPLAADRRLLHRFVRRWRLCLLGVLVTAGLCAGAVSLVGPSYSAQAYILLTPPPPIGTDASPNPYLVLGGMLPLTDVVARSMSSDAALAQARNAGLSGSYTVTRDQSTNGPLLNVTTSAATAVAALKDLSIVVKMAGPELTQMQAAQSVPRTQRVTPRVVSQDTVAAASRKSQIRLTVVAGVVGLVLTALLVCLIDILALRRRARRDDSTKGDAGSSEPHGAGALPDDDHEQSQPAAATPPPSLPVPEEPISATARPSKPVARTSR